MIIIICRNEVEDIFRIMYSHCSALHVINEIRLLNTSTDQQTQTDDEQRHSKYIELLRVCDMAVMMGIPDESQLVHDLTRYIDR
jgi:hypothetical protein